MITEEHFHYPRPVSTDKSRALASEDAVRASRRARKANTKRAAGFQESEPGIRIVGDYRFPGYAEESPSESCKANALAELARRIAGKEAITRLAGEERISVARQSNNLGNGRVHILVF